MEINYQIETVKNDLFKKRMKHELEFLKEKKIENLNQFTNISSIDIDKRIIELENILEISEGVIIPKDETVQQKRENLFKEIDKYTFKKQWTKLTAFHKIVKIKEFIKVTYGEGDFQSNLIDELTKNTTEGKINSKKCVVYDPNQEQILSIPILTVDLNKKTFNLKVV